MKKYKIIGLAASAALAMAVLSGGCTEKADAENGQTEEEQEVTAPDTENDDVTEDTDPSGDDNEKKSAVGTCEPDSLYFISKEMQSQEKMETYAVNMVDDLQQGDIGDMVPAYKDIDLDGDGLTDVIERNGVGGYVFSYMISFSDGAKIGTAQNSGSPNEGEVIEFYDIDGDNIDELLITHFTVGTGGPVCWNTYFYVRGNDGVWQTIPVIDNDGNICCEGLEELLENRGERIADIELTDEGVAVLADFGEKDGPSQTFSYEAFLLVPDLEHIKDGTASLADAFECRELSPEDAAAYWPYDVTEDTIGYLHNETQEEETIPEYYLYVNSSYGYATLYTGPGAGYDVICQIPNDEPLEVYKDESTDKEGTKWRKVAYYLGEGDNPWVTGWVEDALVE
ncbi:MAG: hypothetical protein IKO53_02365 [Lachnospiraceae bacterium]|nr:hypothetical protein [Lachnospiraceae bacterium]